MLNQIAIFDPVKELLGHFEAKRLVIISMQIQVNTTIHKLGVVMPEFFLYGTSDSV